MDREQSTMTLNVRMAVKPFLYLALLIGFAGVSIFPLSGCRGADSDEIVYISSEDTRFHRASCPELAGMSDLNLRSPRTAQNEGHTQCETCQDLEVNLAAFDVEPRETWLEIRRQEEQERPRETRPTPAYDPEEAPVRRRYRATVRRVIDPKTLVVQRDRNPEQFVRIWGIDTPREGQPYYEEAMELAQRLFSNQALRLGQVMYDRLHRDHVVAILEDNRVGNLEMVRAGLAWATATEHINGEFLKDLEEEAREAGRGLWADEDPVPPWIFDRIQHEQEGTDEEQDLTVKRPEPVGPPYTGILGDVTQPETPEENE